MQIMVVQQAVDRAAEEQSRPRSQKSAEEIRQMQTEANDKAMQVGTYNIIGPCHSLLCRLDRG